MPCVCFAAAVLLGARHRVLRRSRFPVRGPCAWSSRSPSAAPPTSSRAPWSRRCASGSGQPLVIDNRGGAGGNIAAEVTAKAHAGRLHGHDGDDRHACDQLQPVFEAATFIPFATSRRSRSSARARTCWSRRTAIAADHGEGAHRDREIEAGSAQLRQLRRRHDGASLGRAFQHDGGREDDPRAVQGRVAKRSPRSWVARWISCSQASPPRYPR